MATPDYLRMRACPTCGGTGTLAVGSTPKGENEPFPVLRQSWFGFFKTKVFFSYFRCATCGQLYNPVYFTDEALRDLYSQMPDNTAGVDQGGLRRTQEGYAAALGEGEVVGDYLELGPDIGLLTAALLPRVAHGHLWLFEPNVAVHAALAERLAGHAHTISREMADFSQVPDGSIGLCTMIHVLDHLPDAKGTVSQLARKLCPGGRLLVVTHDERSLLARLLGRRWPAFCLQHPHLFNRATTATFLRSCGLKVLKTRKSVNHFPVFYLLKHLLFAFGLKSAAGWRIAGPSLPLRLGNIVTVAERAP